MFSINYIRVDLGSHLRCVDVPWTAVLLNVCVLEDGKINEKTILLHGACNDFQPNENTGDLHYSPPERFPGL